MDVEEQILERVEENPEISSRQLTVKTEYSKSFVPK